MPRKKPAIEGFSFSTQQTDFGFNPGLSQCCNSASCNLWVGIFDGDDHTLYAGAYQRVRARRRTTVMAARFEGNVNRRTTRPVSGRGERVYLRMRFARGAMPTFADDPVV